MQTILCIDDDELHNKMLTAVLSHQGYDVVVANNANFGIFLARELKPALILMDVRMKGVDGLEAARQIKSDPELCHIPIVALTAVSSDTMRERAAEVGCDGFFPKPFQVQELQAYIQSILSST